MSNAVKLFQALADETRLRILNLIRRRELCVCQIVKTLNLGQSKVSRHLAHLKNAGVVNDRREGLWMYYSLAEPVGTLHEQVLELIHRTADQWPLAAEDLRMLATLGECGDLCPDHANEDRDRENAYVETAET